MTKRMSGARKAAILLLTLEEEAATEVLRNLNEEEVREVTALMADFEDITPEDVDRVTGEFYLIGRKARFIPEQPETKVEFLRKVLGRALGSDKANEMVEGLVTGGSGSNLERLSWHDPSTIAEFLASEHPQVIAVILTNMGDASQAQAVLSELPGEMQEDVFTRMARLRTIPQEWLDEIEASLSDELATETSRAAGEKDDAVGPRQVARVLGAVDSPTQDTLFRQLKERNPGLAEKVQSRMFHFHDLLKIDNYGIQLVLKNVSSDDLTVALKLADEPIQRHLMRNMAPASAERLLQSIQQLGPVPVKKIEEAQQKIANTARLLMEQGKVVSLRRAPKKPGPQDN
ncbi:MAG: flagellar motor switch protein FliG [Deltaproteobacteria bacterium]|nr:flagellar motor switch protein FliG [Deltaproteobacteria bacterium]